MTKVVDSEERLGFRKRIDRVLRRVTNPDGTLNDAAAEREEQAIWDRIERRVDKYRDDVDWLDKLRRAFIEMRRIDEAEGKR